MRYGIIAHDRITLPCLPRRALVRVWVRDLRVKAVRKLRRAGFYRVGTTGNLFVKGIADTASLVKKRA